MIQKGSHKSNKVNVRLIIVFSPVEQVFFLTKKEFGVLNSTDRIIHITIYNFITNKNSISTIQKNFKSDFHFFFLLFYPLFN